LPVCVLVGWGMTKLIEEPLTGYGRNWRWSAQVRVQSMPGREGELPQPQASGRHQPIASVQGNIELAS
jgi:hypothetical protein